jgi:hypothetical protein
MLTTHRQEDVQIVVQKGFIIIAVDLELNVDLRKPVSELRL